MYKLGGCICDQCKKIVVLEICKLFTSKNKKTKMHFCDERCKLVFLKGKKYYLNKLELQHKAFMRLMHLSEKCL